LLIYHDDIVLCLLIILIEVITGATAELWLIRPFAVSPHGSFASWLVRPWLVRPLARSPPYGAYTNKAMWRTSQGANKPGGEWSRN